jgi:hypothetical protein
MTNGKIDLTLAGAADSPFARNGNGASSRRRVFQSSLGLQQRPPSFRN